MGAWLGRNAPGAPAPALARDRAGALLWRRVRSATATRTRDANAHAQDRLALESAPSFTARPSASTSARWDPFRGNPIRDQVARGRPLELEPAGAGPAIVRGTHNKSPANGVLVDVMDPGQERLRLPEIEVEAAAGLPEEALGPRPSPSSDPGKPLRGVFHQVAHGASADGLLDRLEDFAHVVNRLPRPDDQMHMLGHEDKRPQSEILFLPGRVDGLAKPPAGSFGGQEAMAVIAGERQLVGLAGLVAGSTMTTMRMRRITAPRRHGRNPRVSMSSPIHCRCHPAPASRLPLLVLLRSNTVMRRDCVAGAERPRGARRRRAAAHATRARRAAALRLRGAAPRLRRGPPVCGVAGAPPQPRDPHGIAPIQHNDASGLRGWGGTPQGHRPAAAPEPSCGVACAPPQPRRESAAWLGRKRPRGTGPRSRHGPPVVSLPLRHSHAPSSSVGFAV